MVRGGRGRGYIGAMLNYLRFLTVLAIPTLVSCSSMPEIDLAITGATIIDGTGTAPVNGMTILVKEGQIVAVEPDDCAEAKASHVIDATGKYVVPGLIDLHVHFGRGAPLPRREDEADEVLARQLYYGVTSILQLGATGGSADSIRKLRERRAAGSLRGPFIYGTGGHLTLQGTHPIYTIFPPAIRKAADSMAAKTPLDEPVDLDSLGIGLSFVRSEEAAQKAVRERAQAGMDAIKITVESGPTPFGDDHPQMSVEMIRAIVAEANRNGLEVFAHATSRDELEATLEGGASGIVHAVRNLPLPDADLAVQMASKGFWVVPTLNLLTRPDDLEDPFLRDTVSEQEITSLSNPEFVKRVSARWDCGAPFDDVLANVGMLHEHGVLIAMGTDTGNPFVFPGYSAHTEMELLVRSGLTPMEALVAATRRGAELLGVAGEVGTIQAGKRADILILAEDPTEDIRNTRSLETVVSEGLIVDRDALLRRGE